MNNTCVQSFYIFMSGSSFHLPQTYFGIFSGFAVNGINNVNTTSYERRFDLKSSSVGWISSSFDISAAICGVVIGKYKNHQHLG